MDIELEENETLWLRFCDTKYFLEIKRDGQRIRIGVNNDLIIKDVHHGSYTTEYIVRFRK